MLAGIGARLVMMPTNPTPDAIIKTLSDAPTDAILLRANPKITAAVMDAAPALKVIAKHGAGVDSVDLAAAAARGIKVMVAGDANGPAVAEYAIALILALGRDIVTMAEQTRAGVWSRDHYAGHDIGGRVLGLVGFGHIGRRVARMADALGMKVIALPHHAGGVDVACAEEMPSLPALLARADIVSLHVPLNAETAGMMDAAAFAGMKRGALLVNTARGGLVDEAALLEALHTGQVGGCALDTLRQEPPPADHPLLTAPHTIITAHIAAFTDSSLVAMGVVAAQNIAAVLTGQAFERGNLVTVG